MREDELIDSLRQAKPVSGHITADDAAASDRASESDRIWFQWHPDRVVRLRAPIPREFGPFVDHSTIAFVRVDKVRADTRLRSIITRGTRDAMDHDGGGAGEPHA